MDQIGFGRLSIYRPVSRYILRVLGGKALDRTLESGCCREGVKLLSDTPPPNGRNCSPVLPVGVWLTEELTRGGSRHRDRGGGGHLPLDVREFHGADRGTGGAGVLERRRRRGPDGLAQLWRYRRAEEGRGVAKVSTTKRCPPRISWPRLSPNLTSGEGCKERNT